MRGRDAHRWIPIFAGLAFFPASGAFACEPVIPLMKLYTGGLFLVPSLAVLGGAVALKSVSFALLERRIHWMHAILAMLAANAVSTVIGIVLAMGGAAPVLFLGFLPVVMLVSLYPAKRLIRFFPDRFANTTPGGLAFGIAGVYFLTFILFAYGQVLIGLEQELWIYWLVKFSYVFLAVGISILLTTLWEEWIVGLTSRKAGGFLMPVLKANLITFAAIMLVAAAMMLPERMKSENFLVYLQDLANSAARWIGAVV